jgi:hypothetical protein
MANPQISTPAKSRQEEQGKGEREERGQANTHTHTIKTPPHLQMAAGTAIDEFNTFF